MSKTESADLILKLYESRREPVMREARDWFTGFFPNSVEDIIETISNPETSAYYRMVVSYWDMAATFVNHGAIDEQMFMDVSGECVLVFAKIEPYLEGLRAFTNRPQMCANLESLIMRQPDAKEMLASNREMIKAWLDRRAEIAKGAA